MDWIYLKLMCTLCRKIRKKIRAVHTFFFKNVIFFISLKPCSVCNLNLNALIIPAAAYYFTPSLHGNKVKMYVKTTDNLLSKLALKTTYHNFFLTSSPAVVTSSALVPQGPGLGPIPMSQFGTISRQISRHNSSTTSSASMVSATGTYRRAPSVSSQQPHINGGPAYPQNPGN